MLLEQLLAGLATTSVSGPDSALQTDISDVVYDSRKAVEGTLFVCMVGAETDGHKYARNAYDAGCRVFVLEAGHEETANLGDVPKAPYIIVVENTRVALAKLSDTFFGHPSGDLKVIGITGTKGKTSITYILQSVLEKAGVPTGLIGTAGASWNGKQVPTVNTTPESYETQKLLRQMADDGVKAVAIEVSSLGVKWHRTDFLEFFCGIFTNISPDHIGGHEHKTYEEYYSFKKAFFSLCSQAAACGDDPAAADMLEAVPGRKIFYGLSEQNEFRAENMVPTRSDDFMGIRFDFLRNGEKEDTFEISLPGDFSVHNALAVLAVCELMGLDLAQAKEGLRTVRVPGRCQIKYLSETHHHPVRLRRRPRAAAPGRTGDHQRPAGGLHGRHRRRPRVRGPEEDRRRDRLVCREGRRRRKVRRHPGPGRGRRLRGRHAGARRLPPVLRQGT